MIFDTDVLVSALRGNAKALRTIDGAQELFLSVVTQSVQYKCALGLKGAEGREGDCSRSET